MTHDLNRAFSDHPSPHGRRHASNSAPGCRAPGGQWKAKPRGAGRPSQHDVEERTRQLLLVAIQLFLEHGYAGVSLDTIAKAAHVAVRTIYVKFGGKAGLFSEAIAFERERMQGSATALEADFRPVPEVLTDFGRRYHESALSNRATVMHRVVIAESRQHPDLAQAFFNAGPAITRASLARYFSRPDVRARLRGDMPAEALALHLLTCLNGDYLFRLTIGPQHDPGPDERERHVRRAISFFLSGALKETTPGQVVRPERTVP